MSDPTPTPPPAPHRRRRVLVVLLAGLIALVSLGGLLLVLIDTSPGHQLLRSLLVRVLNDSVLAGRISIDRLEGSLYGDFSISGIRLEDSQGRPALTIDRLRIAYELGALRSSVIHVEAIEIVRPALLIAEEADGSFNVAHLTRPSEAEPAPPEPSAPPAIVAKLDRFLLEDGSVRYQPRAGPEREIRGLAIDVSGAVAPEAIDVELKRLALEVTDPPLPLEVTAGAHVGPKSVRASIDLRAGEASLSSDATEIVLDSGAASGRLRLAVPHTLLTRLGLDPAIVGDLEIEIRLSEGTAVAPWKVDLEGHLAGAPLALEGQFGPTQGEAVLRLTALDPQRAHLAAPPGAIDLSARADFPSWSRGHAGVDLRGEVELLGKRFRVGTLTATASIDGARADLALALDVVPRDRRPQGMLAVEASAAVILGPVPTIESSSVSVRAADLEVLAGELVPLRGVIAMDAQARGPATDLAIDARANVRRLKGYGVSLDGADLEARMTGAPSAVEGEIGLRFLGLATAPVAFRQGRVSISVRDGGQRVGVGLDADGHGFLRRVALTASAAQSAEAIRVDVASLTVDTSSASWTLAPAIVTLDRAGPIDLSPLLLSSTAGKIRARGRIDPARWTEGAVELEIEDLSLGALAGFSPGLRSVSGRVGLLAKLAPGRKSPSVSLKLNARDLRRHGGGPLDAAVELALLESRAQVTARVEGSSTGALSLQVTGRTPRDLNTGAAWQDPRLLESLEARFDAVSLGRLAALTSTVPRIEGRLDGALAVGPGLMSAQGKLHLRDLAAAGRRVPAETSLAIAAGPERVDLTVTSTLAGSKPIRVEVSTNVGTRTWLERGAEAVLDAGAELHLLLANLPAPVVTALAGLPAEDPRFDGPRGVVSVALDARGKPSALELNATVSLFRFALARRAPELDLELVAKLKDGRGRLHAAGALARSGRLELALEALLPAPADAQGWRGLDQRAVRSVEGRVDQLRLAALSELGLTPEPMPGTAALTLSLGPAMEQGEANVRVEGVRPSPRLARLDLAARVGLSPDAQTVSATVSAKRSPLLVARARIGADLDTLRSGRLDRAALAASISVPSVPIESFFKAKGAPMQGRLRVSGEVGGTISDPIAQIGVQVEGAKIAEQAFDTFGVDVRYGKDQADVALHLRESSGGSLDLLAKLAQLAKSPQLQAQLDATRLDLGFIGSLTQATGGAAVGVDGVLSGKLSMSGAASAPALDGSLAIEELKLVLPGEVPPLENGSLEISLAPDRYQVDLRGKLGQGEVTVGTEARLQGLEHIDLSGKLTTDGVRVTAGSQIVALDTSVELTGRRRGEDTEVAVVIGETLVDLPKGRGKKLRPITDLADVRLVEAFNGGEETVKKSAAPAAPARAGALSVTVKTPKPIVARGGENYLEINTDIGLVLGPAKRSMVGEIGVDGRVNILRRRYDFRRGKITFLGSFPPDPRLDLRLGHDFDTMTLLVIVGGTAKKPEVRFASEPSGFDQAALLGIFLGAEPSDAGGKAAGQETARAAASALASQLASRVGEDLPFDTIELDVGGGNRSMSITAGKWLTDDIFVAYQYKFTPPAKTNENQGEGIVRWHFARGWSLETRFGDRAAGSVDAIWLKRF